MDFYIAASWSWAAVGYSAESFPKESFQPAVDVLSANLTLAGQDPFGAVNSGCIELSDVIQCVKVYWAGFVDSPLSPENELLSPLRFCLGDVD